MKNKLKYLKRGKNNKYPLAFISPSGGISFQTNKLSSCGTPRYSMNPNASGTLHISIMENKRKGVYFYI